MNSTWENARPEEILADMNELAAKAAKAASPRLTWRAIPEETTAGPREVWYGSVGALAGAVQIRQIRPFQIVPRPLLGGARRPGVDNCEPSTWDLFTLGPWFPAQLVGNFVELVGAQARARRIWRNNSCLPSGEPCDCDDLARGHYEGVRFPPTFKRL